MLKLSVKNCDIVRISKILAKGKVNASIENSVITIEDGISENVAQMLCQNTEIICISNFDATCSFSNTASAQEDNRKIEPEPSNASSEETSEDEEKMHEILFHNVKRGEVYLCDFGQGYDSEQSNLRHAIVVQNNKGNTHSTTTIVIPCTTAHDSKIPTQCSFYYKDVMVDFDESRVKNIKNTILAEQIRTVSKSRLVKFYGTLSEEFMDNQIQPLIETSLAIKPKIETVIKPEVRTVVQEKMVFQETDGVQDLSENQLQLLSFVDVKELISISKTSLDDSEKARKILELFGFDMKRNGMDYLLEAIMVSPRKQHFNLKTLSQKIAQQSETQVDQNEIERLIVARVKENFKMKKSPTINFIRLVNVILRKEDNNEVIV